MTETTTIENRIEELVAEIKELRQATYDLGSEGKKAHALLRDLDRQVTAHSR